MLCFERDIDIIVVQLQYYVLICEKRFWPSLPSLAFFLLIY